MNDAKPLNDSHDQVDTSSHIVRGESTHERVEFRGGGTDAEQEGDLDEDYKEGTRTVDGLVCETANANKELTGRELRRGS